MPNWRNIPQWWANVMLRNKITGVTVLILACGLLVAGIGTFSLLRPTLVSAQDTGLQQMRNEPAKVLRQDAKPHALTEADIRQAPNTYYVALLDASGHVLFDNADNGWAARPLVPAISPEWAEHNQESVLVFGGTDNVDWRGIVVPIANAHGVNSSGSLLIAYSTSQISGIVAEYATIFTGFGFAVILLGAALTRILITATLDPLIEVQRTAKKIADGDFSQRIAISTPNNEVGLVGKSLNTMLDEVDEAIADREETLAKMRQFIGDAGHELRTPLVTLRGYAELFRMGGLESREQLTHAMERVESEAIRMTSLVEDLLSLARLEGGRQLDIKPLNLNDYANDAVLDSQAREPERRITAVLDPQQPYALGDEHKVRQLMLNLLANAFKHTEAGTPLEIVVSHNAKYACFEVRDHGDGIPTEIQDKIFDRFWRADTSRNRETGGSGLGLAIVSSIVAAHNGEIEVLATEGGGATFRVSLPLAGLPFDDDDYDAEAEEAAFEESDKKPLRGLLKRIISPKSREVGDNTSQETTDKSKIGGAS